MEIRLNPTELAPRLEQVARVVNPKNALPILDCVLVEVKNDFLYLTASDNDMWLTVKAPITECKKEDTEDAKFCIAAKKFLTAIKNLTANEVTFDITANTLTCNYGNGKFLLPYEQSDVYPMDNIKREDVTERIIDGKRLLKAIELTGFATANDELRPVMNGIHFDFFNDGMVTATSDGHKLAKYKDTTVCNDVTLAYTPNFTMPKKPANTLISILSAFPCDVKLSFNNNGITVSCAEFRLSARLLEMRYPNYDAVIPKDNPIKVTVDKNAMLQALKRVLPMSDDANNLVRLDFERGQIIVNAENVDYNRAAKESVTCDCDAEIKIGFKGSTLIEVLRNIEDDNVVIELSEPSRAGVFYAATTMTRDEYLSLVMPMLLN